MDDTLLDRMKAIAKPIAKRIVFGTSIHPKGAARWFFRGLFEADYVAREAYEWGRRMFFATPTFLARCAVHGDRISIDRLPYVTGPIRIELGSNIRVSGKIGIGGASQGKPVLRIGSGVFIGHGTAFVVGKLIEVHDFVSIGGGTYIADTDGHDPSITGVPSWENPSKPEEFDPVVIEESVMIKKNCTILKGVRIGARAVVGAGSVVRTNVPPDAVVAGNPARVVKKMAGAEDRAA